MRDPLSEIRNYRRISENLATAGQPAPEQFQAVRDAGFELIINLATADSPHVLPDEANLLASLGLDYIHLPVDFKAPLLSDLERFTGIMKENRDKKLFVHCALNWRVSAFVYLYRMTTGNLPATNALQDLHDVWQPDATWQNFIDTVLQHQQANAK